MTVRIECNGFSVSISNDSYSDMMECIVSHEDAVDDTIISDREDYERLHEFNAKMREDRILPAFSVELAGSFHTFKLFNELGQNLTDVHAAARFAECEFVGDWNSVFNGDESLERDVWTESSDYDVWYKGL